MGAPTKYTPESVLDTGDWGPVASDDIKSAVQQDVDEIKDTQYAECLNESTMRLAFGAFDNPNTVYNHKLSIVARCATGRGCDINITLNDESIGGIQSGSIEGITDSFAIYEWELSPDNLLGVFSFDQLSVEIGSSNSEGLQIAAINYYMPDRVLRVHCCT